MAKQQKTKAARFSLGWIFVIIVAAFLGLAIWGVLNKSGSQGSDEFKADGMNHPHVFNYSPDESTIWMGTHMGLYALQNGKWLKTIPALSNNDVMGLEINPNQTNTIVVTGHGFVKRTTDGGKTWNVVESGLPNQPKPDAPDAHQLTVNPRDPNHLITLLAGKGKNLFESKDGGQTWKEAGSIEQSAHSVAIAPDNDSSILAATENGIFRYDNTNGVLKETKISNEPAFQLLTLKDGTVFALGQNKILTTKDLKSWSPINTPFNGEIPLGIKSSKIDNNKLLIVTNKLNVYESKDAGKTWGKRE